MSVPGPLVIYIVGTCWTFYNYFILILDIPEREYLEQYVQGPDAKTEWHYRVWQIIENVH